MLRSSTLLIYVPRVQARLAKVEGHINKFVQVVELYDGSANAFKQAKSTSNHGMASVAFLKEDQFRDE